MAAAYGQRPSALLGIRHEWAAWCVDHATWLWGQWVDVKLSETDRDGERKWETEELLGEWGRARGQYRPGRELVAMYQARGGR